LNRGSGAHEYRPDDHKLVCPLCEAPVDFGDVRCGLCGYALAGVDGRPGPYGPQVGWVAAGAFAVVYAIALFVVLIGR
jgi:hypothetical protein